MIWKLETIWLKNMSMLKLESNPAWHWVLLIKLLKMYTTMWKMNFLKWFTAWFTWIRIVNKWIIKLFNTVFLYSRYIGLCWKLFLFEKVEETFRNLNLSCFAQLIHIWYNENNNNYSWLKYRSNYRKKLNRTRCFYEFKSE